MARIKQHYYASERIYFNKKLKHLVKEETEYLIADGRYMTRLTPADLPDWFVHGYYYKRDGYMSAKGVVSMVYHPNLWINHFLKDDFHDYNEEFLIKLFLHLQYFPLNHL